MHRRGRQECKKTYLEFIQVLIEHICQLPRKQNINETIGVLGTTWFVASTTFSSFHFVERKKWFIEMKRERDGEVCENEDMRSHITNLYKL